MPPCPKTYLFVCLVLFVFKSLSPIEFSTPWNKIMVYSCTFNFLSLRVICLFYVINIFWVFTANGQGEEVGCDWCIGAVDPWPREMRFGTRESNLCPLERCSLWGLLPIARCYCEYTCYQVANEPEEKIGAKYNYSKWICIYTFGVLSAMPLVWFSVVQFLCICDLISLMKFYWIHFTERKESLSVSCWQQYYSWNLNPRL